MKFWNNNGQVYGGAIVLVDGSRIFLEEHTYLEFINNTASFGGAICVLPKRFILTHGCFLISTFDWFNITLKFLGNSASIGDSIFVTTLDSCLEICQQKLYRTMNISEMFSSSCIGNFQFANKDLPKRHISTCPKVINYPFSTIHAVPGFSHNLNISQVDEMGNNVGDTFFLNANLDKTSKSRGIQIESPTLKNFTVFFGKPGESGSLTIETSCQITQQIVINFTLIGCPPGFIFKNNKSCVFSENLYRGIATASGNSALMKPGYWAGYIGRESDETLFTGECVVSYCNFNETSFFSHYLPNTNCTQEVLEEVVCGSKRKGVLCTKCAEGYTVFYHSPNLECFNISEHVDCAYGIPLYIISELLPVTIIFLVIIIFKISLTSGTAYSFVFYAQLVLDTQFDDASGIAPVYHPVARYILDIFRVIYGSFNLNIFNIEGLSFCLLSDANVMDTLMFQYATILYAVMLVIVTVLVLRLYSCYCCVKLGN